MALVPLVGSDLRVVRLREASRSRQWPKTGTPRHLVEQELGETLSAPSFDVRTVETSARLTLLSRVAKELRATADIVLTDQDLGVRLAALRTFGLRTPRLAMISYDPFPAQATWRGLLLDHRLRVEVYQRLDLIITVSGGQAKWLAGILDSRPPITSVPMAVDVEFFRRKRSSQDDYVYMVDGAFRDYDVVAHALGASDSGGRLIIAHRDELAPQKLEAIAQIRNSGWSVEMHQNIRAEELRGLYEDAGLVIVPIQPANQPAGLTALLEAMSMGCAVIASQGSWLEEYASHGHDALFIPPHDPSALAGCLKVLRRDREKRQRLAQNAALSARGNTIVASQAILRRALTRLVD